MTRYLQRESRLPREIDVDAEALASEPELLAWISAASVQNRAALPGEELDFGV